MILRVVQVPTGVRQVVLPNWIALHKTPGIFISGGQVFLSFFWDPFLDGWTTVIKNLGLHSALLVSLGLFSLEVAGRVLARTLLDVSCLLAMVVLLLVLTSEVLEQQRAPGGRWQSSGSQQLAGACGGALRDGAFPAVPIDHAGRDHVAGCAGRQGVEQPAPGGRRGFRPLTGALRLLSPSFVGVSKFVFVARFWCHEFIRVHAWCWHA